MTEPAHRVTPWFDRPPDRPVEGNTIYVRPAWVDPADTDRADACRLAYAEAANLSDAQLESALADVADSVAYARKLLAHAGGRELGLIQARTERGIR